MSWHEDPIEAPQARGGRRLRRRTGGDRGAARRGNDVYYLGDTGRLPLDARRALCQLLIGPSIDQLRHAKLWPALIRSEAAIRSSLADLFLELVLDRDSGVAFTRQADTEDVDAPVLLRTSPLTFIDSVLLLYLRQQLAEPMRAATARWWPTPRWPKRWPSTKRTCPPTAPVSTAALHRRCRR